MVVRSINNESKSELDYRGAKRLAAAVVLVARDRQTLAWMWPRVVRDLHGRRHHAATYVLPGIDAGDISAMIAGKGRKAIDAFADQVFGIAWNGLRERRRDALGLVTPRIKKFSIKDEWIQLIPFVRNNIGSGTLAEFGDIRLLLFTHFGAPNDPSVAIKRINTYYGRFVSTVFLPNGSTMKVHAAIESRLTSTGGLLRAKGEYNKLANVRSIGGFNIRRNANDRKRLSNHSFGVACDLDPAQNPNLPFGAVERQKWDDFVELLTGVSPYGVESTRLRTLRTYAKCIADGGCPGRCRNS